MTDFELLVFTVNPAHAREVTRGGAAGIIVDWENKGKAARQAGADTEINGHGPQELERLRKETDSHLICRVNGMHGHSREEVATAMACGAGEILLPMVRRLDEVEQLLEWTAGRCGAGILIETVDALALAPRLRELPLTRVYVGLNDLMIDRGSRTLFDAVVDGTLDQLRPQIATRFGFGGLTVPEGGAPIPCRLLRGELLRLGCAFTFLRRSFWRDVDGRDLQGEVRRILASVAASAGRTGGEVAQDRADFRAAAAAV